MHNLFNEDDWVDVRSSNSGFTGRGQLVAIAFGITWLVRVETPNGQAKLITVKANHLQKIQHGRPEAKPSPKEEVTDKADPDELPRFERMQRKKKKK